MKGAVSMAAMATLEQVCDLLLPNPPMHAITTTGVVLEFLIVLGLYLKQKSSTKSGDK